MSLDTKKLLVNADLSPFIHLHEQIWHETQEFSHFLTREFITWPFKFVKINFFKTDCGGFPFVRQGAFN